VSDIYDHGDRLRSYELIAETQGVEVAATA